MESADDVLTDAFTRLTRLVDGVDRTKTLQYLVFMVSCPVTDFVARALSALVEISAQSSCRAQLVAEGLVPSLVGLCGRSQDSAQLADAAECFANLAEHDAPSTRQALLLSVPALIQMCTHGQDSVLIEKALGAVSALSLHPAARDPLVDGGAVKAVVRICTRSRDKNIVLDSARAFACLSQMQPDFRIFAAIVGVRVYLICSLFMVVFKVV